MMIDLRVYQTSCEIILKTTILKSVLCYYSDMYVLVKGTLTISGARRDPAARLVDERNKQVIFINCVPFCNYISEIRNTKVDNASRCNSRCNLDVNL